VITIRKSEARGRGFHGWLDSRHTFSFADYYDPRFMGFRSLRVINQDKVSGGAGFPVHPHREMEIISYVLEGRLEHEDTMGNHSVIGPGGAQVISGGTGFAHSEYNPSDKEPVHFLQIWIVPDERQHGQPPVYADRTFDATARRGKLCLVVSGDGRDGSLPIRQDADVYTTTLAPEENVSLPIRPGRGVWVHVATGAVDLNGQALGPGDGAALSDEAKVRLTGAGNGGDASSAQGAEVMIFDLG
jgi:redox-sensitive bicupin YhaK (pirin superfamily)